LSHIEDNHIQAGLWLRLWATLIDVLIIFMIMSASFTLVDKIADIAEGQRIVSFLALVVGIFILLIPGIYLWVFTWATGRTLGKRIFNLSVVDEEGMALRLGRSFLREAILKYTLNIVGIFIPIWYIGFIWIGFDRHSRGWHDRISGTYVIRGNPTLPTISNRKSLDRRESISRFVMSISILLVGLFLSVLAINYMSGLIGSILSDSDNIKSVNEPLVPSFYELGDDNSQQSKDEWQRVLEVNNYVADIIPVGVEDTSKELIIFIPGHGLNFQDVSAISKLEDKYQVLILVYDKRKTINIIGYEIADAIERYSRYRSDRPVVAGTYIEKNISIIGHSLGGTVGTLAIKHLSDRGIIGDNVDSLFTHVKFINIDAPWRGIDVPKILTLPGIKHLVGEIFPLVPVEKPPSLSGLSIVNGTTSMNVLLNVDLPDNVNLQIVSVIPEPGVLQNRNPYPVDGWYSMELNEDEIISIWDTFSSDDVDLTSLGRWMFPSFTYKQNLHQLFRTLERDSDYDKYSHLLIKHAKESNDISEFKMRYDFVISNIIDTFQGEHTNFMWEDETFIDWLRVSLLDIEG